MRDLLFSNRFNALDMFLLFVAFGFSGNALIPMIVAATIAIFASAIIETTYKTIWGAK